MKIKFKLNDEVSVKLGADIHEIGKSMDLPVIQYLKTNNHLLSLRSFISEKDAEHADQISNQYFEATKTFYSLKHFFIADFKEDAGTDILESLLKFEEVQMAYISQKPELCGSIVNRRQNPLNDLQGYLNPAPEGVGADYAWQHLGSDGKGINILNVELGWKLDHEDLKTNGMPVPLIGNFNHPELAYHGTGTLGIIGARDNLKQFIGLVPQANLFAFGMEDTSDSLLNCTRNPQQGDIIEFPMSPSDQEFINFFIIAYLTNVKGVTTVISAGNKETNLDTKLSDGKQIWNRNSADFRDSGAIYVGACSNERTPSLTGNQEILHPRRYSRTEDNGNSAYGNRIDCYAWGEEVNTSSEDENMYAPFGGTSGASAIIAGVAAVVQGIAKNRNGSPFPPLTLRQILSDPNNGTASKKPSVDRIGVMPDLKKICANVFNLMPEIEIDVKSTIKRRIIGLPIDKTLTLCRQVGQKTYRFEVTSHVIEVEATFTFKNFVRPSVVFQHDVIPSSEFVNVKELSLTRIPDKEMKLVLELDGSTNRNRETIQIDFRGWVTDIFDKSEMRISKTENFVTNVYIPSEEYETDKLRCVDRPNKRELDEMPNPKSDGPDWGGWLGRVFTKIKVFFKKILGIK